MPDYFELARHLAEQLAAHGVTANSPATKHALVHRAVERLLATYSEQDLRSYCYDRMSDEFAQYSVQQLLDLETPKKENSDV